MTTENPYAPPASDVEGQANFSEDHVGRGNRTVIIAICLLAVGLLANALTSLIWDTTDRATMQICRLVLYLAASYTLCRGWRLGRLLLVVMGSISILSSIILAVINPGLFDDFTPAQYIMVGALTLQVPLLLIPWFGVSEYQRFTRWKNENQKKQRQVSLNKISLEE